MPLKLAKYTSIPVLILLTFASRPASAQQFVSIDVPGATSTGISQINDHGQMAGSYADSAGVFHGLLLSSGVVTTIDYPGAANTVCQGINDSAQIVGLYFNSDNAPFGFLWVNGTFTPVNNPAYLQTFPLGIDDLGNIVGQGIDTEGVSHGFVLTNGVFTNVDYPGAGFTEVEGTNLRGGSLTGAYAANGSANPVGFTYINGQFTSVTYPKSASTNLNDINNGGQVVGSIPTATSQTNYDSFLLSGTNFTAEDFPGAISTIANGLNDLGQVVGWYFDGNNVQHGFVSSTGPFAYIAEDGAGVAVLDTSTNLVVANISLPGAFALAMTPDQQHIYVATIPNLVSIIDTTTNTVEPNTITVGYEPFSVAVSPDGNTVYVPNISNADGSVGNTVAVISTATNQVVTTLTVGSEPAAVAVTPDSKFAYVSNLSDSTVSVINAATNTILTTVPNVAFPWGIAVTPNGASVYVGDVITNSTDAGAVTVINELSNQVATVVPLGANALDTEGGAAITPDGTFAYFTNLGSNNVSVVNIPTNTVVTTIPVGKEPFAAAVSPDGSLVYVGNLEDGTISVIQTASNTVTATIPVLFDGEAIPVSGIAVASAPPSSQTQSMPLSPTQPNVFNFGTDSQTVQYPPGANFSNVVMNTVAQQITQAQFHKRVAGTQFANATCIVYSGNGGNCVDYKVTCADTGGHKITCPSEAEPTIVVETDFNTSQAIVDPGYLTTPIGKNNWQNIFDSFSDPKVKGKTKGFSEFVAVDLGASNPQGLANLKLLAPTTEVKLTTGTNLGISFKLTSAATKKVVTDARANFTATLVADANGNPVNQVVFSAHNLFTQTTPGVYTYGFCTKRRGSYLPLGTYIGTIYGNAFASHQFKFKLIPRR